MGILPTGQVWPPEDGAYDYIETLNSNELAWEFLRRNPDYQRDFAALAPPLPAPEILSSGHVIWHVPEASADGSHWGLWPLVGPKLSALDAPICWRPATGAAILPAIAVRAPVAAEADLSLASLSSVRHIVVRRDGTYCLLANSTDHAIALQVRGDWIVDAPINVTFQLHRLFFAAKAGSWLSKLPGLLSAPPRHICRTPRRKHLSDALIALDGHLSGANYRDLADIIFSRALAATAWSSSSRAMKDTVIRSLDRGRKLARSGYLRLIS